MDRKTNPDNKLAGELYRSQIKRYIAECGRLETQARNMEDTLTRCQDECTKLLLEKRELETQILEMRKEITAMPDWIITEPYVDEKDR